MRSSAVRRPHTPRAIACRWFSVATTGKTKILETLLSPEFVDQLTPQEKVGLDPFQPGLPVAGFLANFFSHFHVTLKDLFVDQDGKKVLLRWKADGIHTAPFAEIEPTKTHVEISGVEILSLSPERGLIEARWAQWNGLSMKEQLLHGRPPRFFQDRLFPFIAYSLHKIQDLFSRAGY